MNHLIAKIKGASGKYLKVLSNKKIFDHPQTLDDAIEYDSAAVLEQDEWFYIKNFSTQKYCIDFLKKDFSSTDYSQIKVDEYLDIEYLIAYQHGKYYFQKLSNRQILEKKFFTINPQPEFHDDMKIIVIESLPNAIYIKNEDTLYFKSLTYIHQIFKGIEILYKEATQAETKEFLESSFISLKNNYNADKVKQSNRKRISLAIEALNNIPHTQRKSMYSYICEYRPELNFDSHTSSFEISNEHELKELLYGLTERYYTTKFGKEKRLANSVIKIQ